MCRWIVTIGGLATAGWIAGCAPAYVEPGPAQPVYGPNYGYGYGERGAWRGEERRERHEAREHERREWRVPEDGD